MDFIDKCYKLKTPNTNQNLKRDENEVISNRRKKYIRSNYEIAFHVVGSEVYNKKHIPVNNENN